MQIRAGYEIAYDCPVPTPMLLALSIVPSRQIDLVTPHDILFSPPIPSREYRDQFGNRCHRILAPAGRVTISADFIINDFGEPDPAVPDAAQTPVDLLPDDQMIFLLGSRYCETDKLMETAWSLFGNTPPGWARVQAICGYVNRWLTFGYAYARPTKTAAEAFEERRGVCRDFAHLAITFCRCVNIPARYCTGYLGDIGVPPLPDPMDFSAWFEAYLDGQWYAFDARHNHPRIGRIVMARGRDATDVAMATTFGPCTLSVFKVVTEEIEPAAAIIAAP
jgi:transglutaminase-like putative cysteine protease